MIKCNVERKKTGVQKISYDPIWMKFEKRPNEMVLYFNILA